jgi:hypothetical protein
MRLEMLRRSLVAAALYCLASAAHCMCAQSNSLSAALANITAQAGGHYVPATHLILTVAFGMDNKKLCTFMR